MGVIHEAWSDEYSTESWVILQKSIYPLFRLVLCFNVACGNDGLGYVLGRKVYERANLDVLILVMIDGLARYECLAYPKGGISI